MKSETNYLQRICVFILSSITLSSVNGQTLAPGLGWRTISWPTVDFSLQNPQNQGESGDEWWYHHDNLYDPNTGDQIGFVAVGYVSWRDIIYDEDGGVPYTSGCYKAPNPPPVGYDKFEFSSAEHTPNGRLVGSFWNAIARYDLEGNMLWCRRFAQGEFHDVIQNTDGDIVAVGWTHSTVYKDPSGNEEKFVYNPGKNDFTAACIGTTDETVRKMLIARVDLDGNLIDNYIYGADESDQTYKSAYSRGNAIVETAPVGGIGCRYLVGGEFGPGNEPFILKLDDELNFVEWYDYSAGDGGYFGAIEKFVEPGGGGDIHYALAGVVNTEDPDSASVKEHQGFLVVWDEDGNERFGTPRIIMDPDDTPTVAIGKCKVTNVSFSSEGDLYFPILFANGSYQNDGYVFKIDPYTGIDTGWGSIEVDRIINTYDNRLGITPPWANDGEFVVVTSVHASNTHNALNHTSPLLPQPNNDSTHWTTGAGHYNFWSIAVVEDANGYVVKYEDNGSTVQKVWGKEFDVDGEHSPREPWPGDIKKQECLYTITKNDDDGYTVAGNCSPNFDDSYIVNLKGDCGRDLTYTRDVDEDGEIKIQTNTVWNPGSIGSSTMTVRGQIIVYPFKKLTIQGMTVHFADTKTCGEYTSIVVLPRGHLEVKSSTLTNLEECSETNWDGISVEGEPLEEHTLSYQGKLTLDDCTIENSKSGVVMGQMMYDDDHTWRGTGGKGGGILEADEAVFRNNRFSLEFAYYAGSLSSNTSYLENCDFINDGPIPGYYDLGISHFVSMWDIQGIEYRGCHFTNDYAASLPIGASQTAIGGINCGFSVVNSIGGSGRTSTFTRMGEGVSVGQPSLSSHPIDIIGARFNEVKKGITLTNSNGPVIAQNNFNIGYTDIEPSLDYHGIHLADCQGYVVEDNEIIFNDNEPSGFGIVVHNTIDADIPNEIYSNLIENFGFGLSGMKENDDLKFRCNELNNNIYAMVSQISPGIADLQGDSTSTNPPAWNYVTAGNCFNGADCSSIEAKLTVVPPGDLVDYVENLSDDDCKILSIDPDCYTTNVSLIDSNVVSMECGVFDDYQNRSARMSNSVDPGAELSEVRQNMLYSDPESRDYVYWRDKETEILQDNLRYALRGNENSLKQSIALFEQSELRSSKLQLADLYIMNSQYDEAKNTLYELKTEYPEYGKYVQLKLAIAEAKQNGRNIFEMGEDQDFRALIADLAGDTAAPGSINARLFIEAYGGEEVKEVYPHIRKVQRTISEEPGSDHITGQIRCYPNPFTDNMIIEIEIVDDRSTLQILDVNGRQMLERILRAGDNRLEINGSELVGGVYLGIVRNAAGQYRHFKIVKSK